MAVPEATLLCATCGGALKAEGDVPDALGYRSYTCVSCGGPAKHAAKKPISAVKAALIGIGAMALGLGEMVFWGYMPYRDVLKAAPTVSLSLTALVSGPLFVAMGFLLLIMKLIPRAKPGEKNTVVACFVVAILVLPPIAGFAAYFWLRWFAQAHGYDL